MSQLKKALDQSASPALFKQRLNIRGSDAGTDTASFGGILSSADDTVQKALDTLDDVFGSDVSITGNIEAVSTDAGASAGPLLDLYRDSVSPAVNDLIGQINFYGKDSAGNKELYGSFRTQVFDVTSGTEDASLTVFVTRSGSHSERVRIGNGFNVGSPTGGFQGNGTLNATAVYDDGVQIKPYEIYRSSNQSITADSAHTFAHGLSGEPDMVSVIIQCTTADLNWSVGDRVIVNGTFFESGGGADAGVLIEVDATNVTVHVGDTIGVFNNSTYEIESITLTSWDLYTKAVYFT